MPLSSVLIVGAGIGGLTAAIALRRKVIPVTMIERDPTWTVYGVGIIQQYNVIRVMDQLDLLDDYMFEAYGFDKTTFHGPDGAVLSSFEAPRLAGPDYPSNAGIRRVALQRTLSDRAKALGVEIRLGLTVEGLVDDGAGVDVTFSDGSQGRYDAVIGADGVFSKTRGQVLPSAPAPEYTGQWVWRYNLPLLPEMEGIHIFHGPVSGGLTPIGGGLMYIFVLSEEPPDFVLELEGSAAAMRARIPGAAPQLAALADQVTEDDGVVGRPLETVFLSGPWHVGRVALLGDAVHASTPHMAQGAGMAIEDAAVLAEEMAAHSDPEAAFVAYRNRRFERAEFVWKNSIRIGEMQMGKIPPFNVEAVNAEGRALLAQPI
ncbi:MAG: FAD-dependent oxidoreductase [Pseudomonadota bacterium]